MSLQWALLLWRHLLKAQRLLLAVVVSPAAASVRPPNEAFQEWRAGMGPLDPKLVQFLEKGPIHGAGTAK